MSNIRCQICGGPLLTGGGCADFTCRGFELLGELPAPCPQCAEKDIEIERLKGLIEQQFFKEYPYPEEAKEDNADEWQQFKTENNL